MKHLATIQAEFLKEARDWDKLSLEEQKAYLKRHPASKRKITAKPSKDKSNLKEKLDQKRSQLDKDQKPDLKSDLKPYINALTKKVKPIVEYEGKWLDKTISKEPGDWDLDNLMIEFEEDVGYKLTENSIKDTKNLQKAIKKHIIDKANEEADQAYWTALPHEILDEIKKTRDIYEENILPDEVKKMIDSHASKLVTPQLVAKFKDTISKHFEKLKEKAKEQEEWKKTQDYKDFHKESLTKMALKNFKFDYDKNSFKLTTKGIKPKDDFAKTVKAKFNYPEVTDKDDYDSYTKKIQQRLDQISGKTPIKHKDSGTIYDWGQSISWGDDNNSEQFELDPNDTNDFANQLMSLSKLLSKKPGLQSQSDNDISVTLYDPSIDEGSGPTENNSVGEFTIDITKTDPKYYEDAAATVKKFKNFAIDTYID